MKHIKKAIIPLVLLLSFGAISCSGGKEQVLIYTTAEEERVVYIKDELNKKFPDYNIVIQEIGTGALVSKLQGEGKNTDCDIIGELEITNMETLLSATPDFFYSLDDYNFDNYTSNAVPYNHKKYATECLNACAIIFNKKLLEENNLTIPTTYSDLLDSKYRNLISMPNPKSSGTGYAFYNGLITTYGKEAGMSYFDQLSNNIKEFTTSGSGPIKSVDRGEIAIGFAMLWQCVEFCNNNSDLGYTYLDLGCPYNLYEMAIINGHEKRKAVKEVFDYIFYELNQKQCEKFTPDKIYKNMTPEDPNYPVNVDLMEMDGICNPSYKKQLLDEWKY